MKILFIGDIHAKQSELEDCRNLLTLVRKVADAEKPDRIVFLGDQNHNHAVVNVFVMEFLREAFDTLRAYKPTALVGNHDMPGVEGATAHAMLLYTQCEVIAKPVEVDGILFVPYQSSPEAFKDICNASKCPTVVCHQTFTGSTYENGFYAKDGVEPNLINQKQVISGHIHAPQEFDKVWYPGAPRWQSLSDANTNRAIWLVDFNQAGEFVDRKEFSTNGVCRQIHLIEHTPDSPALDVEVLREKATKGTVYLDLKGPHTFVEEWVEKLVGVPVRLRTFKDRVQSSAVRESEGIQKAFDTYLGSFVAPNGTPTEKLAEMHKERIYGA